MIQNPRSLYSGLTLVLSYPSRFDLKGGKLLCGYAGQYVEQCLLPVLLSTCQIRTADEPSALLQGTKVVLLFGETAMRCFIQNENSLCQQRGCPHFVDDKIFLATFFPQDAMDARASYEKDFNDARLSSEEGPESAKGDEKATKGFTKRANYRFWLKHDLFKAKKLLIQARKGEIESLRDKEKLRHEPVIFPRWEIIEDLLLSAKDQRFYLDVETLPDLSCSCIGVAIGDSKVHVAPLVRWNKTLAYGYLGSARLLRAIAVAMLRNEVVIHNAMFDLTVLQGRYGLPHGNRIFDTMLAHARAHVGVEKSLGHCISLWLDYEPYHKSEGVFDPKNEDQEYKLWFYNAKDIETLRALHRKIILYASDRPGLAASITQANASVPCYAEMQLTGLGVDTAKRDEMIRENAGKCEGIKRLITFLVGHSLLPTSSKACITYFHKELCWDPVKKSEKTGLPALDKEAMYELALEHGDHPVIPLVLEYRRLLKETSGLNFRTYPEIVERTSEAL